MDAFTLVATLALNSQAYTSGLKAASKEANSFASLTDSSVSSALTKTGKSFDAVGQKVTSAGKTMMPLSLAVGALGGMAIKTGADFDAQMSKVVAISGASADEFEVLRAKAREMGAATKFSATEAGQAFEYMAMAGWKTDDMLNGIEGIMNLAAASGEDLATTSDIVTDALTAFGYTAQDSAHFADVLAAASSNANTNVAMLGESFKYVAPVAGSMGYTAEDTSIALSLMANAGIKASQGGTALRTVLTNMANPTDKMAAAMQQLGVSLTDSEGNMLSLRDIMGQLRNGFSSLKDMTAEQKESLAELDAAFQAGTITEDEYSAAVEEMIANMDDATGATKAQLAATLAGKTGMSGLLAIVSASDSDFNKLAEAIDNSSGTAEKMAETMQDNLSGQLTILMSQLQELAISLSDALMPTFRKIVDWIQRLVDKFNKLSPTAKKVIAVIGTIVAVAGPVLMIVGSLISSIGSIITIIPVLIGAFQAVQAGIAFMTAMAAPLSAAFLPIIGIIAGIIAAIIAVVAIIKHWGEITEWFKGIWEKVSTKLQEIWDAIVEKVTTVFETIKNVIQTAIMFIAAIFEAAFQIIMLPWMFIWENTKEYIIPIFEAIRDFIKKVMDKIAEIIKAVWNAIYSFLQPILNAIKTFVVTVWNAIKTAVTTVLNTLKSIVKSAWELIKTYIITPVQTAYSTISSVFQSIWNTISNVVNSIKNTVQTAFETVKGYIIDPIQKAWDTVSGIVEKLKNAFNFSWSLPDLKLPHISVEGNFSLRPPSVPHFKVSWYAKAYDNPYLLDMPTVIGAIGFGDRGSYNGGELVYSRDKLMEDIGTASKGNDGAILAMLNDIYELLQEGQTGGDSITIDVYPRENQDEEEIARNLRKELVRWENQRRRAFA